MTPVAVKDVLACGERLGITQWLAPAGMCGSIDRVLVCSGRRDGEGGRPLFCRTLVISPSPGGEGVHDSGGFSPTSRQTISCVAVAEEHEMPEFLVQFSGMTGMPVFASRYDAAMLQSRLIGLIREKGERRIMCHGVLVQVSDVGVLIMGDSGIGKTTCGLALVGRSGAFWIADDAVLLEGRGNGLFGRGHDRSRMWIALRNRGLLRVADLLGKEALREETRVGLIVRFVRNSGKERAADAGVNRLTCEMVGVSLPYRRLAAGGDPHQMAGSVMTAVRAYLASQDPGRVSAEAAARGKEMKDALQPAHDNLSEAADARHPAAADRRSDWE